MRISVDIEGEKALKAALAKLGDEVTDAVRKEVYRTGFELDGDIKRRLQRGPKTGRIYTHRFFTDGQGRLRRGEERSVPHQASAPGQAPATDSGGLVRSIYFDVENLASNKPSVSVGSTLAYAAWLEYGTTKIAPRPMWTPAAHEASRKFKARMEAVIRSATQ